jgi:hypothetical protein
VPRPVTLYTMLSFSERLKPEMIQKILSEIKSLINCRVFEIGAELCTLAGKCGEGDKYLTFLIGNLDGKTYLSINSGPEHKELFNLVLERLVQTAPEAKRVNGVIIMYKSGENAGAALAAQQWLLSQGYAITMAYVDASSLNIEAAKPGTSDKIRITQSFILVEGAKDHQALAREAEALAETMESAQGVAMPERRGVRAEPPVVRPLLLSQDELMEKLARLESELVRRGRLIAEAKVEKEGNMLKIWIKAVSATSGRESVIVLGLCGEKEYDGYALLYGDKSLRDIFHAL